MDFLYPESLNNKDSTHSVVYLLRDGNHNYDPAGEDRVQCASCVVPRTDCGFPILDYYESRNVSPTHRDIITYALFHSFRYVL